MDYEETKEFVIEAMAEEFKIKKETAKQIIDDLDLDEVLFENYEDAIQEAEQEEEERKEREWEREVEMNPDLYRDDIHGGV